MSSLVRTGISALAAATGFLITLSVGLLVAADAVIYLIPGEGCDSGCWNNTPLMRALGMLGLAVAAGLMASTPATVKLIRARRYRHAVLVALLIAAATAMWIPWTNQLLASKGGGGRLRLLP